MPLLPDNKFGLSGELRDFSQAQYEVYQPLVLKASQENYYSFGEAGGISAQAVVRGATIRAAIKAEILIGIPLEAVGNMKPPAARWLADQIEKHVREVTNPAPDPN